MSTTSEDSLKKDPIDLRPSPIMMAPDSPHPTRIKIIGIGGGGGNAINRMISFGITGVEFAAVNTDLQDLQQKSQAPNLLQIGVKIQKGLGAGADPEIGKLAAEEQTSEITEMLQDTDLVFLTAGMGGGTGTGATPVVAKIARKLGCLTVAVVTTPFLFEGEERMEKALRGIEALRKEVDTSIIIPNENLFKLSDEPTTIEKSFELVDSILFKAVKGISDLIVKAGFINVDFADVRSIMHKAGNALIAFTEVKTNMGIEKVVDNLIHNPLAEQGNIYGAKGLLINLTYGKEVTLQETASLVKAITREISPKAKCIQGWTRDDTLSKEMKVTVIATGFSQEKHAVPKENRDIEKIEENTSSAGSIKKDNLIENSISSNSYPKDFFPTPFESGEKNNPATPPGAQNKDKVEEAIKQPKESVHILKVDKAGLVKHTPFQEERIDTPYAGKANQSTAFRGVNVNTPYSFSKDMDEDDYLEQPTYLRKKIK